MNKYKRKRASYCHPWKKIKVYSTRRLSGHVSQPPTVNNVYTVLICVVY